MECNADVLADMILHDVLDETVCELQKTEDEDIAEEIAWNMQQAPSVTNLVQRLQEMEVHGDHTCFFVFFKSFIYTERIQ